MPSFQTLLAKRESILELDAVTSRLLAEHGQALVLAQMPNTFLLMSWGSDGLRLRAIPREGAYSLRDVPEDADT